MMKNYKTKNIPADGPPPAAKQTYAFPDREDIPVFTCEAGSAEEAQVQYEAFVKNLTQ